ncbi:FtsX-like permease family protein [Nonomuraea sp. NPDC000554]|uniref:FtsX-like permease family protein n=1 Tax=Nonomuraea sp. NPDC000554 TaxID=3154259 RepID=UPI003333ECC8
MLRRLYATLRERRSAFAGTFVALLLGVAIVAVTSTALLSAGPRLPERLSRADVLVAAPAIERPEGNFTPDRPWSPDQVESLQRALEAVPGVAVAVPDRSFYAQPVVGGTPVEGHQGYAWSAAALGAYRLISGAPPRRDGEVVADRRLGLAVRSRVTVLTARGPATYTVSGTTDGPGLYLGDGEAAKLAGGVRTIGLVAERGAGVASIEATARDVVGRAGRVFAGEARVALEPLDDARIRWIGMQVLTAMAALAAFASIFVVASTFAFAVAQRRNEFGLLRAVGATPRQVRGMVYREALAIGALGSAAGVVLGAVVAPGLGELLVTAGFEPRSFTVSIQPLPLAGSFAVGVVVALLGSWTAARRAARVSPLEALREAAVDERPMPRGRWIGGGLLCVSGLAGAVVTAGSAGNELVSYALYTAMALILGLALLAPAIVPPVARLVTWPLGRLRGATGMLVRESALVAVRRTASTATPVLVTVGFAVLITGMVQTTAAAVSAARATSVRAEAVIVPEGTPGLSDAAAAGGASLLPTAVYGEDGEAVPAVGADPSFAEVGGDRMVIESWVSKERGWRAGQAVRLTFEDGRTVPVTVAAVVDEALSSVLLSRDLVRTHDPSALAAEAFVTGRAPSALPAGLGARVVGMDAYAAQTDDEEDRLVWLFTVLLVIVSAGYTGVAIAGTLAMSAAGRTRDLVVLRLAGATARQVLRAVVAESVLVVALGTVLGLLVALPTLLGMRSGLATVMSTRVALVVPVPLVLGVVGACLLLAAGAAVLTARSRLAVDRR